MAPLAVGAILAGSSPGFCWAPFSDAVAMLVEKERRNRVLSVISTETTFGLIVAGPVVILVSRAGGDSGWRWALALFAVAAFGASLWNLKLLPSEPYRMVDTLSRAFRDYLCTTNRVYSDWKKPSAKRAG